MMKSKWMILMLALASVMWMAGCANEDEGSDAMSDEEALTLMMQEDEEIEGVDAWSGDDNLEDGGGLDEEIDPVRWGRVGRRHLQTVNVVIEGDSLATITSTSTFNGEFRIGAQLNDTTWQRFAKPMYNTVVRKAQAIRIARTPYPRQNWRIVAVTPVVMASAEPNPHTIEPERVQVYQGEELIADVTDPLNTYFDRQNLPTLAANAEVTVYLTANTTAPGVGVLHPHVFRHGRHPRLYLNDTGLAPDELAGDGIYSGSYWTNERVGVFCSGFDLIDYETLYDTEGAYDSGGWAIPYRISAE
jgi:hypothetical protein